MDCMRNQLYEGVLLHGRYETISPLNHGSFGMVFRAKDLITGDDVAIKVITKSSASSTASGFASAFSIDERSEELNIHLRLGSHPNVVNLLESFESQNHIYLVLEFCPNGDLYEAIREGKGPLETEHVRDFMFQLVNAVEFTHAKGIAHRDIKPENIFLTADGSMKLGDYGLATTDAWSYEIAVGSDRYMAPEQYDPPVHGYSTMKADIWALGICLLNVLFSRNPFVVPANSDPLYADFALDRQSLFDVFPNLSQDTYEVLVHCLALDPAKRDLSLIKEALNRVISFTTDDESLDEFCTEERISVIPSANREPLRTPSISTPQLDQSGSFPWAKALAMSPPQPIRQLSAIPDTEVYAEDLFPRSEQSGREWFDVKPDSASTASFVDSGLGLSFKSSNMGSVEAKPIGIARSRPVPISGSLPVTGARPFHSMASVFGKKRDMISKSWSDLWDEEEEESAVIDVIDVADIENNYLPLEEVKEKKQWNHSENGSGVSTPRGGLVELKNPAIVNNSRSRSPKNRRVEEHVSEQTGFVFEEHTSRYSPPPKRNPADKWAALGERRRQPQTPQKPMKPLKPVQATPVSAPRKRSRTGSWRRPIQWGPSSPENNMVKELVREQKEKGSWVSSKDWRHHPNSSKEDDIGDLEWVGGWNDLHL